jgi:hypothetical protein
MLSWKFLLVNFTGDYFFRGGKKTDLLGASSGESVESLTPSPARGEGTFWTFATASFNRRFIGSH